MTTGKIRGVLVAAGAALLLSAVPAQAQEDDGGPQKWGDDARYVRTSVIKFKAGKRERAMQIIAEYFRVATEKAGTPGPIMIIHMQTGRWDLAAIWEMEGGTADLEWYRSPNNIKWREALVEVAGGEEEAGKIMQEWSSSIADSMTNIGHYHTGEE
jgi:hypothetical protein